MYQQNTIFSIPGNLGKLGVSDSQFAFNVKYIYFSCRVLISGEICFPKNRRSHENAPNNVEAATASVNYQTDKTFHHEAVLDNGERHGEYGYIDPIGIRRVVTYTTGPARTTFEEPSIGGIIKSKENDYVGPNTYFEAS